MTRFLDGPAAGVTLLLRRAPEYLRAVQSPDGRPDSTKGWDALDQLHDEPAAAERIVVYRMEGEPSWMHVNRGHHGSGVYRGGTYRVVEPQPADLVVRNNAAWRQWVSEQVGQPLNPDGTAVQAETERG